MSLSPVHAQEASTEVRVAVKGVKVQAQNTPQFNVQNVVDKRWKPKVWLEIDVDFEAKKAPKEDDKSPVIESLEFRYFIGLNKTSADGKNVVLTANITYNNVVEKEEQHALAFVAPSALTRVLEKTNFSTADVKAVGVEIYRGGAVAGFYSSMGNTRWWAEIEKFSVVSDVVLAKPKTPFATLWGDYDLEAAE
ncbi:hypothetical protein FEM03_05370 [Phragmitibacter flavus]|uniref:Uncharacterized protein n=1 Tax=Phragmitibacter flavus TaxID=2576071 RepID=A0A5R8KHX0_9BACT|nr:Amuc_1102 family pilus-like protein [Phragmitibacter flavus]TLD71575.1 hypothetical protein FEM03_05370 [Phragmitibacter flavus]